MTGYFIKKTFSTLLQTERARSGSPFLFASGHDLLADGVMAGRERRRKPQRMTGESMDPSTIRKSEKDGSL